MNQSNSLPCVMQDVTDSLLSLVTFWESRINPKSKFTSQGSLNIELATGGITTGDVFIIAGDYYPYFDAIARALAFSEFEANRQTLIMGNRSHIRHTLCELFARVLDVPVSYVINGNMSDCQWHTVNKSMLQLRRSNNLYTVSLAGYEWEYLKKTIERTMVEKPEITVILINGLWEKELSDWDVTPSLAQRLKFLALRFEVAILVSVGLHRNITKLSVETSFPSAWEVPTFIDGVFLCRHTYDMKDTFEYSRVIEVQYDGRAGAGTLYVPLFHDTIARLDVCPLQTPTNNLRDDHHDS